MIIHNTSFHMEASLAADFLAWARRRYIPAFLSHGSTACPLLTRVEATPDPSAAAFCFQFTAAGPAEAAAWHDSAEASRLRLMLQDRMGQKLVMFSTTMEILPLK